jgi:4-coumarate--CoA ligase
MIRLCFVVIGELNHALDLSKPKLVFVSEFTAKKIIEPCKKLKYIQKVIVIGQFKGQKDDFVITLDDFIAKYEDMDFCLEEHTSKKINHFDQVALIVNSSGTTGLAKVNIII